MAKFKNNNVYMFHVINNNHGYAMLSILRSPCYINQRCYAGRFLFIRLNHKGKQIKDVFIVKKGLNQMTVGKNSFIKSLLDKFINRFDILILTVLTFIIVSLIVVGIGYFMYILNPSDFAYYKYLVMVCSYIFTFGFTLVISNIVKWSDNYFFRTIQKSIFYVILGLLVSLLLAYLGIDLTSGFRNLINYLLKS